MHAIKALFARVPVWLRLSVFACLVILLLVPLWMGAKIVKTSHSDLWVPQYLKDQLAGRYNANDEAKHFIFLMCDHWEPGSGPKNQAKAQRWLQNFEDVSARHTDSQGRNFQYSWFYPIDNFDPVIVEQLAASSGRGFGEIEVHWHHYHDGGESFAAEFKTALTGFTDVGALISSPGGKPRFSFIHGNWTLDNSGADRLCGVNDEIQILQDLGCYADLTFPALGTSAQPKTFNQIFYCQDTPEPKSYDTTAEPAALGKPGAGLMMIPGPLGLDFKDPRIFMEYGSLDDAQGSGATGKLFSPKNAAGYFKKHRVDLWNRIAVGIEGKPEWVFVKIHAHGFPHADLFFDGEMDAMLTAIEEYCAENDLQLHYVTAREAYNLVKAVEADTQLSPEEVYDFQIPPPLTRTAQPAQ